jgi:hypothetical protein
MPSVSVAIASLHEGKAVIPVWLDVVYQQLQEKMCFSDDRHNRS